MLIIFTGHGKGKTTAALGQALRAIGSGSTVLMVQFIKGPWESGEHISIKKHEPQFTIIRTGKGFVGIGNDNLPRKAHTQAAVDGLYYAQTQALTKQWNVLILDEIWNALSLDLLSSDAVSNFITTVLPFVNHLIMTGRDAPQVFVDRADLVTEMREIKHPFAHGIAGKKGLEY
jgi:cob(I)alamin adenosyltransferase